MYDRFHHDVEIFHQAVSITQLRTGFAEQLIEKDYFCSLLLEYLAAVDEALAFTCLLAQNNNVLLIFAKVESGRRLLEPQSSLCAASL